MAWSPNGRWIALHSHREQSDDIWLRPADGHAPDRRVSFLGRGAEVGWPRWSPDGRWVLYDGASPTTGKSALFVIGHRPEQRRRSPTKPREVVLTGFEGDITHGEWLPDSATLVAIGKEGPGRHAILVAPAAGGAARVVHRFATEHDFPGLAVAPDGALIAFVAPAPDGFFQMFQAADRRAGRTFSSPSIRPTRPSLRGRPMDAESLSRSGATTCSSGCFTAEIETPSPRSAAFCVLCQGKWRRNRITS